MKNLLLACLLCVFSAGANAGAFSAVRAAPVTTAGMAGTTPVVQVAQPYTFTQGTAANSPVYAGAANAAQYSIAGAPASNMAQAALGVGVAAAGLFASPAIGAVLGVLTVGAAGYALYQELQKQGIKVSPDGSATIVPNYSNGNYFVGLTSFAWNTASSPTAACQAYSSSGFGSVSPWSVTNNGSPSSWICHFGANAASSALMNYAPSATTPSNIATNADVTAAIDRAIVSPQVAADAAAFAQARGLNPLSFLPTTAPNLASAPYSATLPDGTVVSVTPASTLGGSDTISPSPTSITNSAPAQNAVSSTVNNTSNITNITNNTTNTTPDICATNPTASACADLGTAPVAPTNPTGTIDVSGTNFNSIAFAGNSTCPAPSVLNLHSGQLTYSYQPMCDFMSVFKPIALAVAMFIAGLIMFGQRTAGNE